MLDFLKREYPGSLRQARVRSYGLPGIRQTRWIAGRQQLTVEDVRAGTPFADAVARTAWPIELHDRPEGYVWEPFADDHMHYVPFGSLVPAEADNLVAAGRCIDGDSAALSSVRVMGPASPWAPPPRTPSTSPAAAACSRSTSRRFAGACATMSSARIEPQRRERRRG